MFQSFYESSLQHPLLLLVAPTVFLLVIGCKKGNLNRALLLFTGLTILDPIATGPLSAAVDPQSAETIAIFFVILGDFRWFFFFELFTTPPLSKAPVLTKRLLVAVALSFIVPLIQASLIRAFPSRFDDPRKVFLAYEGLFFLLALGFLVVRVPRMHPSIRAFKRDLCWYGLIYYGLWATSDVLILARMDVGFLLRVVPNQLYYSFFLPFVWWRARRITPES